MKRAFLFGVAFLLAAPLTLPTGAAHGHCQAEFYANEAPFYSDGFVSDDTAGNMDDWWYHYGSVVRYRFEVVTPTAAAVSFLVWDSTCTLAQCPVVASGAASFECIAASAGSIQYIYVRLVDDAGSSSVRYRIHADTIA